MCRTVDIIQEVCINLEEVQAREKMLNDDLIMLSQTRTDILHMIEAESNMNASRGYELSKALNRISIERRNVKYELKVISEVIEKITSTLPSLKILLNKAKVADNKNKQLKEAGIKSYHSKVINLEGDIRKEVDNVLNKL